MWYRYIGSIYYRKEYLLMSQSLALASWLDIFATVDAAVHDFNINQLSVGGICCIWAPFPVWLDWPRTSLIQVTNFSFSYIPMAVCNCNSVENIVPTLQSAITNHASKWTPSEARCARRIEKRMRAHPHVRLGHGSKRTAHIRVDTSLFIMLMILPSKFLFSLRPWNRKLALQESVQWHPAWSPLCCPTFPVYFSVDKRMVLYVIKSTKITVFREWVQTVVKRYSWHISQHMVKVNLAEFWYWLVKPHVCCRLSLSNEGRAERFT